MTLTGRLGDFYIQYQAPGSGLLFLVRARERLAVYRVTLVGWLDVRGLGRKALFSSRPGREGASALPFHLPDEAESADLPEGWLQGPG